MLLIIQNYVNLLITSRLHLIENIFSILDLYIKEYRIFAYFEN